MHHSFSSRPTRREIQIFRRLNSVLKKDPTLSVLTRHEDLSRIKISLVCKMLWFDTTSFYTWLSKKSRSFLKRFRLVFVLSTWNVRLPCSGLTSVESRHCSWKHRNISIYFSYFPNIIHSSLTHIISKCKCTFLRIKNQWKHLQFT